MFLSWENTSCCPLKGHCLSDRWMGCQHERNIKFGKNRLLFHKWLSFIESNVFRFYLAKHLRENGVVEYSRQGKINVADHMIEMLARLKPQGVTGLVSVDNNLHRDCMDCKETAWKWLCQTDTWLSLLLYFLRQYKLKFNHFLFIYQHSGLNSGHLIIFCWFCFLQDRSTIINLEFPVSCTYRSF